MNNEEQKLTQQVLAAYAKISNSRHKILLQCLIKHVHAFVRETELTQAEWEQAWQLLVEMGQMTKGEHNEVVLLSDLLGVSTLVDMINHRNRGGLLETALLGPFYRDNQPERGRGATIADLRTGGEVLVVSGSVRDREGQVIAHAMIDTWQAAPNGLYENQDAAQRPMNLRGRFYTDSDGSYVFKAIMPTRYPVPTQGPGGRLLKMASRHPYRPAHIHFLICKPGYQVFVTQVFDENDEVLQTDAVFGVKGSLIGHFQRCESEEAGRKYAVQAPFYHLMCDFVLTPGDTIMPKAPIA